MQNPDRRLPVDKRMSARTKTFVRDKLGADLQYELDETLRQRERVGKPKRPEYWTRAGKPK